MTVTRSPPPHGPAAATPAVKVPDVLVVAPEWVLAAQMAAIASLTILHIAVKLLYLLGGHDQLLGFARLLDMDREANIPSFYSMTVILANAILLTLIGALHRRHRHPNTWFWLFLAGVFVFLAYDEAFSVHEEIGSILSQVFGKRGGGRLSWVIAGFAFVAVIAVASVRFLSRLQPRTRKLMIASGAIFVTGALGLEVLGGLRYERVSAASANTDPVYLAMVTVEESLEMLGMALFSYALLHHLRASFSRLIVQLS